MKDEIIAAFKVSLSLLYVSAAFDAATMKKGFEECSKLSEETAKKLHAAGCTNEEIVKEINDAVIEVVNHLVKQFTNGEES